VPTAHALAEGKLARAALRIVVRDTDQDRPISMPDTTGSPDHSFTLTAREAGLCVEFSHAGNNLGRWLLNQHSAGVSARMTFQPVAPGHCAGNGSLLSRP
jgi:hypothetical protein